MSIKRRKTRAIKIKDKFIGSDYPVLIQSMCNVHTENVKAVIKQIKQMENEECDMVRIAVPNIKAAEAIPAIKSKIKIPLIADIHFDYRLALAAIKNGIDKVRINPGNIGQFGDRETNQRILEIIKAARKANIPLRIGVNSGSLEQDLLKKYNRPSPEALVASALRWIKFFENHDFCNLVISLKSSDVLETVRAYELLAHDLLACDSRVHKCDYPFHIGITEAGVPPYGIIKSAVGIGALLVQGIGDTIRVSATDDPINLVRAAKNILKSLHLYKKEPEVISCPTCGRTEINVMQMARKIEEGLQKRKKVILRKHGKLTGGSIKVTVLGCAVNAIGEAKEADWGIAGGRKAGLILKKGKVVKSVSEDKLVDEFFKLIDAEY